MRSLSHEGRLWGAQPAADIGASAVEDDPELTFGHVESTRESRRSDAHACAPNDQAYGSGSARKPFR